MPLLDYSNSHEISEHVRYRISMLADYFHMVPHIDVNLQMVNATFDPYNNIYLESLGILVAIPGFWLILTLFAFLIFFLCRCCDSASKKKKKITPLKWILALFALLCCGALSLGLFGNDQSHSGMMVVQKSTQEMENVVKSVRNETLTIEQILDTNIRDDVEQLSIIFSSPIPNATVRSLSRETLGNMRANISHALAKTKDMNIKMKALDMRNLPKWIQIIEFFRWPGTIGVLCVLILICLLLLWGVIRHSRCLLILFSVLGLLSVVLCWVLVSLYFGISVAASDFCLNPEPFFNRMAGNSDEERLAIEFYMTCEEQTTSPFLNDIRDGTASIDDLQRMTQFLKKVSDQYLPQREVHTLLAGIESRLGTTEAILRRMATLLDCSTIQNEYLNAMEAICANTLEGVALMLVSAAGSGLLFTILIWIASHTWIHIRSRKSRSDTALLDDEDHPFLAASAVVSTGTAQRHPHATSTAQRTNTYAFFTNKNKKQDTDSSNASTMPRGSMMNGDIRKARGLKSGQGFEEDDGTMFPLLNRSASPRPSRPRQLASKSNARLAYLYDANNYFPSNSAENGRPAFSRLQLSAPGVDIGSSNTLPAGSSGPSSGTGGGGLFLHVNPSSSPTTPVTNSLGRPPHLDTTPSFEGSVSSIPGTPGGLPSSSGGYATPIEFPLEGGGGGVGFSTPIDGFNTSSIPPPNHQHDIIASDEAHSSVNNQYYRNSRGNGREDQAFLHARYTPPPAYDHLTVNSGRPFHYELPTAPTMYS